MVLFIHAVTQRISRWFNFLNAVYCYTGISARCAQLFQECNNTLPYDFRAAPSNEEEMMVDIFAYIDRLMAICRPRRLLYMAIDGVVSIDWT